MKESRRDFLKAAAHYSLKIGVALPVGLSAISGAALKTRMLPGQNSESENQSNSSELNISKAKDTRQPHIADASIGGINFKLFGVSHDGRFAKEHYDTIDSLVKNSSAVVLESCPEDMFSSKVSDYAKAYFGTVMERCMAYSKIIISPDPLSTEGIKTEGAIGIMGALIVMAKAPEIIKYPTYYFQKPQTRRNMVQNALWTAAGLYMFMGSTFYSIFAKTLISKNPENFKNEKFMLSHITDQRNVELTNRLKNIRNYVDDKTLNSGDYVLVNFGQGHTIGVEEYLKHPNLLKAKSKIYKQTYGRIDNDIVGVYTPVSGGWERKIVKAQP